MDKQVRDGKERVALVLADTHIHRAAVRADNNAVQCERDSHPLVLLDTAVIMSLEIREAALLKERVLLEIEAG